MLFCYAGRKISSRITLGTKCKQDTVPQKKILKSNYLLPGSLTELLFTGQINLDHS
jgi:hypothetical protein